MGKPTPSGDPSTSASERLPMRQEISFWGMATFMGLYGFMQTPQYDHLDPAWAGGVENFTHTFAGGLAAFVVFESVRRLRQWIRTVRVDVTLRVKVGERAELDRRDS